MVFQIVLLFEGQTTLLQNEIISIFFEVLEMRLLVEKIVLSFDDTTTS
jgi:hypothetical protein